MKKTLITLSLLSAASAAMGNSYDLTGAGFTGAPSSGAQVDAAGISADEVFNYDSGAWHVSIPNSNANGFVGVSSSVEDVRGSIFLQGGAYISGTAGLYAAVKIDATQLGDTTPVSLKFDCVKTSGWGGTEANAFDITVQFIAYKENGEFTVVESWTETVDCTNSTGNIASGVELALNLTEEYSSYGIIISATRDAGDAKGGAVAQIQNLTLVTTPEPTTATLSLLALAGLCARRRRK